MTGAELRAWLERHGIGDERPAGGMIQLRVDLKAAGEGGGELPAALAEVEVFVLDDEGRPIFDRGTREALTTTRLIPVDFEVRA